ncbi:DUF4157 domain-containing protein [Streptomyces brevispora]|uniref:eCIS core domain-containing protein n=1 Tax=Streptomyces brevispora TaxID=887462 RepID=UPI0033C5A987
MPEHEQERRTTRAHRPRPRDQESDRPPGPVAAPGSEARTAALQRTVGNAAVARMLANRPVQRSAVRDVLGTTGRPLEQPVRADMEARFGTDFSDVRLHTDATAQRSAAEIGARAYTSGHHIVLGAAKTDEHTLAHELTHVVQQRSGPVAGTDDGTGLKVSDPADRFERAAEANAHRVMAAPRPRDTTRAEARRSSGATAHDHAAVQRAPSATGPAPAIGAAVQSGENEEGVCGNFSRVREWEITNPRQGVLIQKVTRRFAVERHTGQGWSPIDGPGLDAYVQTGGTVNGSELQYWELWQVDADGHIHDGGHDTFGMTSLIRNAGQVHDTTRGSFSISGEAYFYATAQLPTAMGFQRNGAVSAGGLFSRTTDPQSELAALGLTPAGGPLRYTAEAGWDSTDLRSASVKAKPRTAASPYTPRAAWSKVRESTA